MNKLPKNVPLYLPELLEYLDKEDYQTQRELIVQYLSIDDMHFNALSAFVELMVHPEVIWELPIGSPPYNHAGEYINQGPNNLFRVFKELSVFLRGGSNFIQNNQKRETHWVVTLESLSKAEGALLCQIKEKELTQFKNIDMGTFLDVYPDFLPKEVLESFLVKKQSKIPLVETFLKEPTIESKPATKKAGRPSKNAIKS